MPMMEEMIREKLKEADKSDTIGISLVKREGAPEDDITIFQKPAGMNATMLSLDRRRNTKTVQVQFEDGTTVDGTLCDFINGLLHKTGSVILRGEKATTARTGVWMLMACLRFAQVKEYTDSYNLKVVFEDGQAAVCENINFSNFCRGLVKHPNYDGIREQIIFEYLNKKWILQKCGMRAQMIGYTDSMHIKVRFEDGTERERVEFHSFRKGNVLNPNLFDYRAACAAAIPSYVPSGDADHIGDRVVLACGVPAKVIARSEKAIKGKICKYVIQLEDANQTKIDGVQIGAFKKGTVAVPGINTRVKNIENTLIGQAQFFPSCYGGMRGEIIRYEDYYHVHVRFDNGETEVMSIEQFETGKLSPKRRNMIHMKKRMNCGYIAEIIGFGRKAGTVDVLFHIPGIPRENCINRNKSYREFRKGNIGLPRDCPAKKRVGISVPEMYITHFILSQIKNAHFSCNDKDVLEKKLELDAVDLQAMIAVEFNGGHWHKRAHVLQRDNLKAQLCEEKGIRLIRILDSLYTSDDCHEDDILVKVYAPAEMEKAAKTLLEKLAPIYHFVPESINTSWDDFQKWYDNLPCAYAPEHFTNNEYVGQTNTMTNGRVVECIGYRNAHDADFRFVDDRTVVEHRTWQEFTKGNIAHPKDSLPNRIDGKIFTSKSGAVGVITAKKWNDVWVVYKNGIVRTHVPHTSLKRGSFECNTNSRLFKRISANRILTIADLETEEQKQLATRLVAKLQRLDETV